MRSIFLLLFVVGLASSQTQAQCEITADVCDQFMTDDYVSDGQEYRALLLPEQVAEFHTTLFEGNTYRFSACTGEDGKANLVYRFYDQDYNLIFANSDHNNSPYWDFKVEGTIDCIVEAELAPGAGASGCAVLLVGFKQ